MHQTIKNHHTKSGTQFAKKTVDRHGNSGKLLNIWTFQKV